MRKTPSDVTAHDYALLFNNDLGERIIDDLVTRFCGVTFVRGAQEAERQTTYNIGRRDVVEFILGRINADAQGEPDSTIDMSST